MSSLLILLALFGAEIKTRTHEMTDPSRYFIVEYDICENCWTTVPATNPPGNPHYTATITVYEVVDGERRMVCIPFGGQWVPGGCFEDNPETMVESALELAAEPGVCEKAAEEAAAALIENDWDITEIGDELAWDSTGSIMIDSGAMQIQMPEWERRDMLKKFKLCSGVACDGEGQCLCGEDGDLPHNQTEEPEQLDYEPNGHSNGEPYQGALRPWQFRFAVGGVGSEEGVGPGVLLETRKGRWSVTSMLAFPVVPDYHCKGQLVGHCNTKHLVDDKEPRWQLGAFLSWTKEQRQP